jgi:hypothetical protein
MTRPAWDFDYARPRAVDRSEPGSEPADVVVATAVPVSPDDLLAPLCTLDARAAAVPLLARPPLFWTRITMARPCAGHELHALLAGAGVPVRYVASARHPSQQLGTAIDWARAPRASASGWPPRSASGPSEPVEQPAHAGAEGWWFLDRAGVNVDRARCGSGHGTRLAVIDHDAGQADRLALEAIVPVGCPPPSPRSLSPHGACLVGWAVGAPGARFAGIAPDASPRLYCIPRPGLELVSLPVAIVRAVDDGADVVACASYVDGMTSPMLDDALELATVLGRAGLGTAVVLASSREISSPDGLVRSSLSLDLGDPASDPRVLCVGPSARDGGWFLWRARDGMLRPFANRGPAVRWLAPGDDVADPLAPHRLRHAESSGATAFAAGVALLVLGVNPALTLADLDELLVLTACRVPPRERVVAAAVAAESELRPNRRDADGHNAKHGYGRLDATRACLGARDPIALGLLDTGQSVAAERYAALPPEARPLGRVWSPALAGALARALLADFSARRAAAVLVRHARLIAGRPDRAATHHHGAAARQLALLLRRLARSPVVAAAPAAVEADLAALAARAADATSDEKAAAAIDRAVLALATRLWPQPADDDDCATGHAKVAGARAG